jgi:hypothetical protein
METVSQKMLRKVLQALFDEQRDCRIILEGKYTHEDIDIYKRRRECS